MQHLHTIVLIICVILRGAIHKHSRVKKKGKQVMKLDNKSSYELVEEIVLTDSELQTVQGGCSYPPTSSSNYSGGYPSDSGSYPSGCSGSSGSSGSSNYYPGSNYASYTPGYNATSGDSGNYGNSTVTTYTVTTTTYSVTPAASSC